MKIKKKNILIMLLCFFSLFLSGCWDKREIKHLGVVSGVAIDREENGLIRLTVDLLNGSPGNDGHVRAGGDYHLTGYGETIYQAISNLEAINNRSLTWQHNSVIILSESALDQSVFDYLDMFVRYTDMRPKAYVVVTPERAFDVINTPVGDDWVNSLGISRLLYVQGRRHQGKGNGVSVGNFITDSVQDHVASYLPIIILQEKEPDKKESAATESTSNFGQLTEEVALNGFAIFRDGIFVGELGYLETNGLLWYTNRQKRGSLSISGVNDEGIINLELIDFQIEPKFVFSDDKPLVKAKITVYSNIVEIFGGKEPKTQEDFQELMEHQKDSITDMLQQTLKKSQEMNADFLGIAQLARRTNYKWWKENQEQWETVFPQVQFDLDINSNIYFSGNIHDEVK